MRAPLDGLQIGSWPSSRALYGLDVMLSFPEELTSAAPQPRGTTSPPTASQQLPASEHAPSGSQRESGPALISAQLEKSRLEGSCLEESSLLQSVSVDGSGNIKGKSSSTAGTTAGTYATDDVAAAKLMPDGSRSEAAPDASSDGSSSRGVMAGDDLHDKSSFASPNGSNSKRQPQLRRAQPQLLEINSSPDFSLVAKQWPNFLNDAFAVLFLPHQKIPESFIAV